jgi:glycosyltransferase involved in cell wall biosynthesis
MAELERTIVRQSRQQVISSRVDRLAIGDFNTLHVIPNGVDLAAFPYVESGRQDNLIVMTGHMRYFPNVDVAVYFATRVFPLVRRRVPDAVFYIVGADPPSRVRKLERGPGIVVTGRVPRVWDYLARAAVAVAPLRTGSGIQNKVLEAMASGAPVVATTQAVSALDAVDGEHLLVADDAEEMAERIVELLKNRHLRLTLARRARKLVEERYTWERAVSMLEQVYELAIEG